MQLFLITGRFVVGSARTLGIPVGKKEVAMSATKSPPAELTALLTALDKVEPNALSSCPGWTCHHIAAHICGNYEEIEQHVVAFEESRPLERTRTWEEREQPLRELDHTTLLERIEDRAAATAAVIGRVLDEQPEAELTWTSRTVRIAGFPTHLRSEDALHRWDLVGDDETSHELLGQQDLLVHAVSFIGLPLLRRGLDSGAGSEPLLVRVRSEGRDDLMVEASADEAHLTITPPQHSPTIEGDPAARLLLLWGRKPAPFYRLRAVGDRRAVSQTQALLAGY